MIKQEPELRSFDLRSSVVIDAAADKVWQALTLDIAAWWGAPYLCCDDTMGFELDLQIGGSFYETGADGTRVLWGIVSGFTPGSFIEFTGCCGMAAPVHGSWSFMLESADDGTTKLSFRHAAMGCFGKDHADSYDKGWHDLLAVRLKAWIETGRKMGLGHEPE